MQYKAVIFDMDGVLIDSEPLWQEAGKETLEHFGVSLSSDQYHSSTGLRTEEWVDHWFRHFGIPHSQAPEAVELIIRKAIEKTGLYGKPFPGVAGIIDFFRQHNYRIGLATSSPLSLVEVVIKKLNLENTFQAVASAEFLPYGKPHPQVYLDCAEALNCRPTECIAFEDSFNGLIAAKAARMKCVVVPAAAQYEQARWDAADLKLGRLADFSELELGKI